MFSPSPVTGWTQTGGRTRMTHNFSIEFNRTSGSTRSSPRRTSRIVSAACSPRAIRTSCPRRPLRPEECRSDQCDRGVAARRLPAADPQFTAVTERTREGVDGLRLVTGDGKPPSHRGSRVRTAYTLAKTMSMGSINARSPVYLDPRERLYGYDSTIGGTFSRSRVRGVCRTAAGCGTARSGGGCSTAGSWRASASGGAARHQRSPTPRPTPAVPTPWAAAIRSGCR